MSRVTKIQKRNKAKRRARDEWWARAFAAIRRHRPAMWKRPPKRLRHLIRRNPEMAWVTARERRRGTP